MEKLMKIGSGKTLSHALKTIVEESIKQSLYQNAVKEKARQDQMLDEEDDDLLGDEGAEDKPDTSKTGDAEHEKLKKGEITTDDVVEKLNAVRAGKSFKDEAIAAKLDEYISSLSKAERTALLAFLKGLAQIVTGEVPAETAAKPSKSPGNVEMEKSGDGEKKTKSIKPNVIKAPKKEKTEKKPSSEDTAPPVPIKPKK